MQPPCTFDSTDKSLHPNEDRTVVWPPPDSAAAGTRIPADLWSKEPLPTVRRTAVASLCIHRIYACHRFFVTVVSSSPPSPQEPFTSRYMQGVQP